MHLFTFSGIGLTGANDGVGLRTFGQDLVRAAPAAAAPVYFPIEGVGHFSSSVTASQLLAELIDGRIFTPNGSDILNREADQLSPIAAQQIVKIAADAPAEPIFLLGHSQGTNNLVRTVEQLLATHSDFLQQRPIRCLLLDAKVSANRISHVFGALDQEALRFLFVQSENDLYPTVDSIGQKFIDAFPFGDQLWVFELDHSDVRDWATISRPRRWLKLNDYKTYALARLHERHALEREAGFSRGQFNVLQKLRTFSANYARKTTPKALAPVYLNFLLNGSVP